MRALAVAASLTLAALSAVPAAGPAAPSTIQFVFTSDSHFGLTKKTFRGRTDVDAAVVNEALVTAINALPSQKLPKDGGIGASLEVGPIDFVANGGDIANRAEVTDSGSIQPAAVSWAEFERVYLKGVRVTDHNGRPAPVFAVPGNHDVSNAIGYPRPMQPAHDGTALAGLYNLMMKPATPVTPATLVYPRDRVLTTRDIGGVHFIFLTVWADSSAREWMMRDLATIPSTTPVMIVTHDQPDAEGKHFTNPNGQRDINPTDKFENLLVDALEDGPTVEVPSVREQSALERVLSRYPNVTAYFHGNSNWNQFYDWTGPEGTLALHAFRVDSPMKGDLSATDETRLSFQLATIDMATRRMTVREVLYNAHRGATTAPGGVDITWGASTTVALAPRPAPARVF